jgi:hypothetical protein
MLRHLPPTENKFLPLSGDLKWKTRSFPFVMVVRVIRNLVINGQGKKTVV